MGNGKWETNCRKRKKEWDKFPNQNNEELFQYIRKGRKVRTGENQKEEWKGNALK